MGFVVLVLLGFMIANSDEAEQVENPAQNQIISEQKEDQKEIVITDKQVLKPNHYYRDDKYGYYITDLSEKPKQIVTQD
jgi:hypothetical protein